MAKAITQNFCGFFCNRVTSLVSPRRYWLYRLQKKGYKFVTLKTRLCCRLYTGGLSRV